MFSRAFCTVAACGLDAEVSRRARTSRLPLPGVGVYVVELLRAIASLHASHVTVRTLADDVEFDDRLLLLAVANTPTYGGGFRIAPLARVSDGLLDCCAVREVSRTRALTLFPKVFRGKHEGLPEVKVFRCESLRFETDPPLGIEADDEPLASSPVEIRCDRSCLAVAAPAP